MKTKSSILILVLLLCQIKVFGQVPRDVINSPTPEVASLGTYGNVPVSLYTGQPNISIPLHEIKSGSASVSISLDYNLSSVKPNRHTSWVGLGWALSAGGYITRNVRGVMDEKKNDNGYAPGFYAHKDKLSSIHNVAHLRAHDEKFAQTTPGTEYELMADEFSFNFCGYHGSFYLSKDEGWIVVSDNDIQVVFEENNGGFINKKGLRKGVDITDWHYTDCNRFFNKFTLVTPDGLRYTFGEKSNGGVDAVEYSISYYNRNSSDLIPTTWYLTKIETPEGNTIKFIYESGAPVPELKYSPFNKTLYNQPCNKNKVQSIAIGYEALSGHLQLPVYLETITTNLETVSFRSTNDESGKPAASYLISSLNSTSPDSQPSIFENYSISEEFHSLMGISNSTNAYELKEAIRDTIKWRSLQGITISTSGSMSKTYYFEYDLLINLHKKRSNKMLLSLTERRGGYRDDNNWGGGHEEIDPSNKTAREYIFDYYNLADLFHNPTVDMEDSWGYYGGGQYKLTHTAETVIGNKSINPSSLSVLYIKAGTLKSIQYPTGGRTIFEYEQNKYSKVVNDSFTSYTETSNLTGGGLRVSEIKSYIDDNTIAQVKRYYYNTDSVPGNDASKKSSGILKRKPVYESKFVASATGYFSPTQGNATLIVLQPGGFLMQTTNDNTPFIGYSSVIEETLDSVDNSNGYVRYRFSNYDTDIWGETHLDEPSLYGNVEGNSYANPFSSRAQERGKLLAEDYYDAAGKLKKSIKNQYQRINENSFLTINQENLAFCTDPALPAAAVMSFAFETHTYSCLLSKQIVTEYPNIGNAIQTETQYSYNSRKLLSETSVLGSDEIKQITRYIYPFEIKGRTDIYTLREMTEKNILSNYIAKISYLEDGKVLSGEYQEFNEIAGNTGIYKPERIYILPKSEEINVTSLFSDDRRTGVSINTNHFRPEIICKYNKRGNIIETKNEGDGISVAYLWGYDNQYPVAKIENATYEEVKTALGYSDNKMEELAASPYYDESPDIKNLRTKLPNAQITTYTHAPGIGILTATNPSGVTVRYYYDNYGRLKIIRNHLFNMLQKYDYKYYNE
jgi:hypothetical protein